MKLLNLAKPRKLTLGFFLLFVFFAFIIPYGINFTTKVTWEEFHGIPFRFLQFSVCFGVCNPRRYFLEKFDIVGFTLDILIWYMIACIVSYGVSIMNSNKKMKAIVT